MAPPAVTVMFDRQARRTPGLPAVDDDGTVISYQRLATDAARLSAVLRHHLGAGQPGAGRPGPARALVALCVDRSYRLPLAILAILQAGAAYVPLDAAYPPQRLSFMLADSGAAVLLTQQGIGTGLTIPRHVAVIDIDAALAGPPPWGRRSATLSQQALAYVMYTSGSTGTPKGVAMPHGPLANLIQWQAASSGCGAGARTLQFSAASFDASFQEMFSTWSTGGCLVLVSEDVRRDPHRLIRFVDERAVSRLFMPFVALQALAHAAAHRGTFPRALCEVVTAGEQLHITPALRAFFTRCGTARLINQYGPSETHIVTGLDLHPDPGAWPDAPAIGRAITAARIEVRDAAGNPVPPGETGEIYIGGPVLADGYLGRPGLTAERFMPDPRGAPGARAYRTGDLGTVSADGLVHFLGRCDHQVKIRGYRVEPGEVESVLKALPSCRDAVVVVHDSGAAGKRLIGYVLTDGDLPADIRPELERRLPSFLIPAALVPLRQFPLTPSGKVDRLGLAAREVVIHRRGGQAAQDGTDPGLLELWSAVTGTSGVAKDDSFFEVGGTSLTGALLVTRLNERYGVDADLRVLYENHTPETMSAWIAAQVPGATQDLAPRPR